MKLKASLFFFALIIVASFSNAQDQDIKFSRISLEHGLSQSTVKCIVKDSRGYMWFGTRDGLNKYDGYKITVYKNNPEKKGSLCNNFILAVYEDRNENLWVGTARGLDLYNRKEDSFKHFSINGDPYVKDIFQDSRNNLWIAANDGLYLYNPSDQSFKGFVHNDKDPNSIVANGGVNKITVDNQGILWIASWAGLEKFNPDTKIFSHYSCYVNNKGDGAISIFKDSKNNIWVGGGSTGLYLYDRKNDSLINFSHNPLDANSLCHNDVLSLTEDHLGRLWIGTQNGGISVFDHNKNIFKTYTQDVDDHASISNNSIHSLYTDNHKNIWIGTWAGGVNYYSRFANKFTNFKKIKDFKAANIYAIKGDNEGNIWIGVEDGGLVHFDRRKRTFRKCDNENSAYFLTSVIISMDNLNKDTLALGYHRGGFAFFNKGTGKFTHFFSEQGNVNSIQGDTKPIVMKDHENNVYIGDWGGGINFYDKRKKNFTTYNSDYSNPKMLSNGVVFGLYEDKENKIWVGTEGGVHLFDPVTKVFTCYPHDEKNKKSLSHNIVYSVFEDSRGNLWVGTGGGLNLMDRKTSTFIAYKEKDGLPNGVISSILEDGKGNLWLGTNKGISMFNSVSKKFKNYDTNDGLQGNEFNRNSAYRANDGTMFFGGTNGFNVFHPDSVQDNLAVPEMQITDLQIFNKSIAIGDEDSLLKSTISETKAITLSYKQSVFAIEYAALNYTNTNKNEYAYKLEGFDKDWIYVKGRRLATYTNLNPGKYTFRVKGSNNDGVWNNKGVSLNITITPPFWETLWFKSLTAFIIISAAYSWYRLKIRTIKKKKAVLERQVAKRTIELREANTELTMQKEEIVAQSEHLKEVNAELVIQKEEIIVQSIHLKNANTELTMQKEEIMIQTKNLSKANAEINTLYSEIKDSIRAAEIIQKSVLPSQNFIKQYLSESFILYKPKDVVSGDFYWFNVVNDKIIIAVADCTGHGVSGAFMSINGYHLLNHAILSLSNPDAANILNRLNDDLRKVLHTQGENEEIQDGMDIALCVLDKSAMKLQFAGANSPLYILRDEEVMQVKGNKFGIGLSVRSKELFNKFSNNEIELKQGDMVYMFSDGYADQLGGPDYEKFMYPRFRELLKQIGNEDLDYQHETLLAAFNDWKKDTEQIDDILVIGFRI